MPSFDDTVDSTLHKETLPSFEVPNISAEDSIISLPIKGVAASPQQVEYNIVHKGFLCGGNLLVDNFGFSYTIKAGAKGLGTTWRCVIHNRQPAWQQ